MWDVLWWIEMPAVLNVEITPERINEYISFLDENYEVMAK